MKTHQLKTNINCNNCVAKVTPYLDQDQEIEYWEVDTKNPDKILTVRGAISEKKIKELVSKAGYQVIADGFWKDAAVWKRAGKNTLNCLIGCTIGDFSMMIYLQTQHPELSMWLTMSLAMATGLTTSIILETVLLKINEKYAWSLAFKVALSMSFLSMLVMELAENITDLVLTGGQFHAHDIYYWFALSVAMLMGFIVPLPYNYFKLKKYNKACH